MVLKRWGFYAENKMSSDSKEKKLGKVLVVDDEPAIRSICSRYLSSRGWQVDTATDGEEALAKILDRDWDIVITDIKMPGLDGVQLVQKAKAEKPYIEFIVMTAYASVDVAVKAMRSGAYDFLLKPLDLEQLQLTVDRCWQKMQLREENELLRLANERLRELHQLKDKFLAITSHELRTPVSNIKSFAEFLMEDRDLSEEEREEFLGILKRNLDELEAVVEDMHAIMAAESGGLALSLEPHNVNESAERVVSELRDAATSRQQTLELDLAPQMPTIPADALRLRRALRELVQNAIKFTPDGGRIVVRTRQREDEVVIEVEDNGIGIPEVERERIFEKFYEVENSLYHTSSKTAFKGGGIGLGLNIARTIVEAHGGKIELDSEEGKGSTFRIVLPLIEHSEGVHVVKALPDLQLRISEEVKN